MTDDNKVIKSYALDDESIGILDNTAKDLGVKSRSEALRQIIKVYEKWQKGKKSISEN